MYIGQRSISCLAAFIDGWSYALNDSVDDGYVFKGFTNWLAAKYEVAGNRSWDQIVRFYSSDEYGALLYFFELWNEYLATQCVGVNKPSADISN